MNTTPHVRTVAPRIASGIIALLAAFVAVAPAHAQYWVIGNFCSSCMETGPVNQLHDDGLHNDGAAGDDIWGADIVSDKLAGQYFFHYGQAPGDYAFPRSSFCYSLNGMLWTSGPGDVVHFQWGGGHPSGPHWGTWPGEWFPAWGGSSDHSIPEGAEIEFVLNGSLAPAGGWRCRATRIGSMWSCLWRAPAEFYNGGGGTYYVTAGPGVGFYESYNAFCMYGMYEMPVYWSAPPGQDVLFEFDATTGQFRNTSLEPTPTRRSTWGEVKAHYR